MHCLECILKSHTQMYMYTVEHNVASATRMLDTHNSGAREIGDEGDNFVLVLQPEPKSEPFQSFICRVR